MTGQRQVDLSRFFVTGINYKKTDALMRGNYAINPQQYAELVESAPNYGMSQFFVLSTCNRTEIYGFADQVETLSTLLCSVTAGSEGEFSKMAYVKRGIEAVGHVFQVAAGLDSQILGDYEIVGQLKQAVKFSKERQRLGSYLDRMVNAALHASKSIKNATVLSSGTVSVSFAAIQYIKENVDVLEGKKVLLLGIGKIGRNTCKNLVDYLGIKNIVLINRTEEKALSLSQSMGLQCAPISEIDVQITEADIIIVATNASAPVVNRAQLEGGRPKLILDLSIPCNVEDAARLLPHIKLVNVDELSKTRNTTLDTREAAVPMARKIIADEMAEFLEWHEMRKNVPGIKALKSKLLAMNSCELFSSYTRSQSALSISWMTPEDKIQKVINGMAQKMRRQNQQGCYYIEAINEYISTGTN